MARNNQVATTVDDETKRRIRLAAAGNDETMSEFIRAAVEDYLSELEGEPGNRPNRMMTAD